MQEQPLMRNISAHKVWQKAVSHREGVQGADIIKANWKSHSAVHIIKATRTAYAIVKVWPTVQCICIQIQIKVNKARLSCLLDETTKPAEVKHLHGAQQFQTEDSDETVNSLNRSAEAERLF